MKFVRNILLVGLGVCNWLPGQAQYIFMPNARRQALLDSLNAVVQTLNRKPASFRRDTVLFNTLNRFHYHYLDVNRPFDELTRSMSVIPDSMYRLAARWSWQKGLVIAAIRQGNAISYLGDKVAAVRLYKEALQRCQHESMHHEQAGALINLAACFAYRRNVTEQDWQHTVAYMNEALAIARRHGDVENIHQYYNLMGDFHVIKKQYTRALPFYEAEQPLMDKHRHLSGYRTNLAYLGICYLHNDQETKAGAFLKRFFAISNTDQGSYATYLHYVTLSEIGDFYLRKKAYQKALFYQIQYEKNLPERTLFDRTGHYEAMSHIYGGLKKYRKAYQYQQRYITARDSLKLEAIGQRFAEIEHRLAIAQNHNQIRALQYRELQHQNQSQRTWLVFLVSLIILFSLVGGLLFYSNQLRKQSVAARLQLTQQQHETTTRIIQTQEAERQRIAADLHDELGGTLATLRRLLDDIRQRTSDPETERAFADAEPLIQKSSADLRRISHNLMPPEFARIGLRDALEQLVNQQSAYSTQFTFLASGMEQKLPIDVELNAYRIVSELIQNINKHAQASRAAVQLLYRDDQLTITVEDDGLGNRTQINTTKTGGIGLKSSSLRAEYIGATLWRDVSEAGTLVVLEIPYPTPMYAARNSLPNSLN